MFRQFLRFSFIPTSFIFWLVLFNGYYGSYFSLFSFIALLGIYTYIILSFLTRTFNLKPKARWFFYFFLATTTLILVFKTTSFFKTFQSNGLFGLFALLLLASWGISLVLSLSFGIKLIHKVNLKKLTHGLRTAKGMGLLSLLLLLIIILVYSFANYISTNKMSLFSQSIPVAGTGSMYPTFPKGNFENPKEQAGEIVATINMLPYPFGINIFGNRIFGYEIGRGDIVTFKNATTDELDKKGKLPLAGFIKRVIGLPGDEISTKDGLVYLNGQILKEPYVAKARSTFGGQFLSDCKTLRIPKGKIFVMGDNRKASDDSRIDVGFVDLKDVKYVTPLKSQLGKIDKGWHDPKNDDKESARIILDKNRYVELLNNKRKEAGLKPLTYQPKLEQSASLRGKTILKYDDFSYEATRSGYTQIKAMNDVGYSNTIWNEGIVQGNYDAEELIGYLFEYPDWKKNLLEVKDYQEIGIAEVQGKLNGCPAEIIVQDLAGYVPPNYKAEDIQSWGAVINDLNNVIPSWEKVKNWPNINHDDLNKLLGLMYQRKNNAEAIYYRMKANQWLTSEEQQMVNENKALFDQVNNLANKLNGK